MNNNNTFYRVSVIRDGVRRTTDLSGPIAGPTVHDAVRLGLVVACCQIQEADVRPGIYTETV